MVSNIVKCSFFFFYIVVVNYISFSQEWKQRNWTLLSHWWSMLPTICCITKWIYPIQAQLVSNNYVILCFPWAKSFSEPSGSFEAVLKSSFRSVELIHESLWLSLDRTLIHHSWDPSSHWHSFTSHRRIESWGRKK